MCGGEEARTGGSEGVSQGAHGGSGGWRRRTFLVAPSWPATALTMTLVSASCVSASRIRLSSSDAYPGPLISEGSLEAASASTACMQSSRDLRHLRREKRTSLDCPL
jgi:hypothetical protein